MEWQIWENNEDGLGRRGSPEGSPHAPVPQHLDWSRATVLRSQLPRGSEVPSDVQEALRAVSDHIAVVQGPDDLLIEGWEDISKDPSWVHLRIPGTHHLLSFHLLPGRSALSVHSMGNLDWADLSWFTFSAAHAHAIDALEQRRVITSGEGDRLRDQLFSSESFTIGYGDPKESQSFHPVDEKRFFLHSPPMMLVLGWGMTLLGLTGIFGLEDALGYMLLGTMVAILVAFLAVFSLLIAYNPLMFMGERYWGDSFLVRKLTEDKLLTDCANIWEDNDYLYLPSDEELKRFYSRGKMRAAPDENNPGGAAPLGITGSMENHYPWEDSNRESGYGEEKDMEAKKEWRKS